MRESTRRCAYRWGVGREAFHTDGTASVKACGVMKKQAVLK